MPALLQGLHQGARRQDGVPAHGGAGGQDGVPALLQGLLKGLHRGSRRQDEVLEVVEGRTEYKDKDYYKDYTEALEERTECLPTKVLEGRMECLPCYKDYYKD